MTLPDGYDFAVVGAGVVGLAVAAELARRKRRVVVLERHASFGEEASSRNSGVIHAGIYYREGSLKAGLCVEGNRLLYEACQQNGIPHRRCGKLIVATNETEVEFLDLLLARGERNGAEGLRYCSQSELAAYGSRLKCVQALYSPSTGIVDCHSLMEHLETLSTDRGGSFRYESSVTGIQKDPGGYRVEFMSAEGGEAHLRCEGVINCGGLHADEIAGMAGMDVEEERYSLSFDKGEYFRIAWKNTVPADVLIYRARRGYGIGVHTVIGLDGEVSLGPIGFRSKRAAGYAVDSSHGQDVFDDCIQFLPQIRQDDLIPHTAGISPRVQRPEKDFIVADERDKGFPGLINLVGMDSPALTGCLAIARHVVGLI
jgi:L-2-hydroxyglutarate oxidase LhgO